MTRGYSIRHDAPTVEPLTGTTRDRVQFDAESISWEVGILPSGLQYATVWLHAGRSIGQLEAREATIHPPTETRPWHALGWPVPQPPSWFTAAAQALLTSVTTPAEEAVTA